ncbi:heptaprenylglyceryl phosphate synthase [Tepidibacillus infernus]|uniref:Heptaprenylglyceryl phosphate synthase n=1 Tax=Tepidibacillus decaturensis TaxID=1413211 RepID=A0A135L0U9_9BACI|nr:MULTISPECIES: heptaprenylglyceryl phosphate synthase [Tepidibacillus]KXG42620.1 geranylgeranylglyceryl/heptaprenylglyceryl phosphate synthase [Tepidibacillus decaturensis]GBF10793.1 heptaprenylglyceryl phosphate synthase [Tepidibacillus sp. HK-1]
MSGQWLSSLKHMFKLDPNRPITEEQVKQLCESGTDAILIGGTLGITYDDTAQLLRWVRKYSATVLQEVSDLKAIVPGFDYYFIPFVVNAQNPDWILNIHQKALKMYGELINWNQVFVEGYVVLNQQSSVAKLTESRTDLDLEDVLAYARIVDQMLKLPILYIEYSGAYGNPDWLKEIKNIVQQSKIFYGGGIDSIEKSVEMSQYADTIIIGNLIYEDFELAMKTVKNINEV